MHLYTSNIFFPLNNHQSVINIKNSSLYTGWVICRCTLCCVSKNRKKGLILFIVHTICRLFHQNALSFVTIWRAVFYVDNALMIISWKIDVGSIQMQNIILYVVAVGSSHPLFYSYLFILFPLGINVITWCYLKMFSINNVCLIFKHCIRGKKTLPIVFRSRLNGFY